MGKLPQHLNRCHHTTASTAYHLAPPYFPSAQDWPNSNFRCWKLVGHLKILPRYIITDQSYSGLVGSIIRFIIFFQKNSFNDGTWSGVDLVIWTQLETGTYLMSACLMTYRPILERLTSIRIFKRLSSIPGSKPSGSKEDIQRGANVALHHRSQQGTTGFHPLTDNPCEDSQIVVTTDIEVAHKDHKRDSRKTLEQGSIM